MKTEIYRCDWCKELIGEGFSVKNLTRLNFEKKEVITLEREIEVCSTCLFKKMFPFWWEEINPPEKRGGPGDW